MMSGICGIDVAPLGSTLVLDAAMRGLAPTPFHIDVAPSGLDIVLGPSFPWAHAHGFTTRPLRGLEIGATPSGPAF